MTNEISIALCTFNGSRFLRQQLQSYADQTLTPAEVVICDDRSSDATVSIAEEFASAAPFPVRIEVNSRQLGVCENFGRAIGLCRGELIALSDQDDVWLPQKLRRVADAFAADSRIAMVFSDAHSIDEAGADLGYRLWDAVRFTKRERRAAAKGRLMEVLLRHPIVTGATLAFRSDYRRFVMPVPSNCQHDQWIAIITCAVAAGHAIEEPLVRYRQHATQTSGGERILSLIDQARMSRRQTPEVLESLASQFEAASQRLAQAPDGTVPADIQRQLGEKIAHIRTRARIRRPGTFRPPLVLKELISARYFRYSYAWRGVAADLFL